MGKIGRNTEEPKAGRPYGAITQCKEIRAQRRENALRFSVGMWERLALIEKWINEDPELKASERYRLLIDIERVRQNEVTLSVPTEQSLKVEDETNVKNARRLLMEKSEVMIFQSR